MKAYCGSGGIAPRILDLDTRWGEWSASRPAAFPPGKEPLVSIGQEAGRVPVLRPSATENLGYHELKQHKPWFGKCSKLIGQRKHAKL
jgi:hypothetical protein